MKKVLISLLGFLVVFVFEACNASNTLPNTPIVVQPTNTVLVFPTSNVRPAPTVDPLTPTAIAQFFQTLEARTPIPEPTSTANYRDCSSNLFFMSRGRWGLCHGLQDPITIISQSNQKWNFSYKEYYGRPVPAPCTRLLNLTDDNKFLYFSLDHECELIEPGFITSISVFRMDLSNGAVKEILKAFNDFDSYSGTFYTASISSTGRRIVYIDHSQLPLVLEILDFQTGVERSFPLEEKFSSGGSFTWSADGTKLAFMLENEKDDDHFISMVFLDLLKHDSMVTFIKDKEFRWISSRLEVTDRGVNVDPYFDTALFYNIETGILSSLTP